MMKMGKVKALKPETHITTIIIQFILGNGEFGVPIQYEVLLNLF